MLTNIAVQCGLGMAGGWDWGLARGLGCAVAPGEFGAEEEEEGDAEAGAEDLRLHAGAEPAAEGHAGECGQDGEEGGGGGAERQGTVENLHLRSFVPPQIQ